MEYRARISELEATLTTSREQIENLKATLGRVCHARSHFYDLFRQSPVAHLVHDSSGFIFEINAAGEELLGVKPKPTGRPCLARFVSESNLLLWLNHMRECSRTQQPTRTELTLRSADGQAREVQLITLPSPTPFPDKPRRFQTVLSDVGTHRAAELALNQTQRDYQRLIDMIEGIVWEADASTLRFIYINRYAERLLGYLLSDWTRPGFWESRIYIDDRERVLNQVNRAITKRSSSKLRLDYRVVAADRRLVWLHDSITLVERGGVPRLLGVAIDVTEQRLADEQLRLVHATLEGKVAERTAELRKTVSELEAFSYSLSHDMRAPIRAMRGYAELLQNLAGDKLGPKAPEFLRRIMSSAERLDLLVQDVLQFNRVARAPLEMKPISLGPLVSNIVHDYPMLEAAKAQIVVQEPLLPIRGHEAFVGQALSNLLTNAVKFIPAGRTPKVRLWTEETWRGHTAGKSGRSEDTHWVRIYVEDNGLGIAPEDQRRIFHMFERVNPPEKYEGTGIGLAIVQKAVERMEGRVGVESVPGQGSKFWIELLPA